MKTTLLPIMALFAGLGVSPLAAQTRPASVFDIPFAFHVRDHVLPAGEYKVTQNVGNGVVQVKGPIDGTSMFVLANACQSARAADKGTLEFHRYGSNYFLSRIWTAGYDRGSELTPSKAEQEIARGQVIQMASVSEHLR